MGANSPFDVIIVGAGPAGLSAALNAHRNDLHYILLEKTDHLADTIHCYQKTKFVMAEPSLVPRRGELWLEPTSREELLEHWNDSIRGSKLKVVFNAAVTAIAHDNNLFQVTTGRGVHTARRVVLAIGTQGNPRKLGVTGEDLPHVFPRLIDPEMYSEKDVVVVGAGDSAAEITLALAAKNRVTMAVRAQEFSRVKPSLERQLLDKARTGEIAILFGSAVEAVDPQSVTLKLPGSTIKVPGQVMIVKIGTLPPRSFLEECGITFASADSSAPPRLNSRYEASVPGLFLVGAASARGDLIKHAINQGYEVIEHICGREVEPADEELLKHIVDFLPGIVSERIQSLVARAPILAGTTEEQLRELLLSSKFHRTSGGEIIFNRHDYSETLYIILDGSLDVINRRDDGLEEVVVSRGAGEFVGEMSLISGRRRSATVRAGTPALLWEVGRKAMLKLTRTTPAVRELIDKAFITRALQTYLFPASEYPLLAPLSETAKVLTLEKGKAIIKEEEPGDAFYFLRSGLVKVSKIRHGREVVLAYLAAGQYFGEMALLRDEPRMASVTAVDNVELLRISREDFVFFLNSAPEFKDRLEAEVRRRSLMNIEVELRPELAKLRDFVTAQEVVVSDNVLLIDENRCIHCDNCVKACEAVHDDGQTRLKRTGIKFANILVANSCRHCENPLCMTDCPPGDAIVRDSRGEVYIRDNCIACGNCATNCPYDNIFMVHPEDKRSWLDRVKEAMGIPMDRKQPPSRSKPVKCDLCRDLEGGPACVHNCPTGAVLRLSAEDYYQTIEPLVVQRKAEILTS